MAYVEPLLVAQRVVVTGRVQGVYFRDSCRNEAEHLGVRGWVRNLPDGSVEAWFEGPAPAVSAMVDWSHRGPRRAIVTGVSVTDVEPAAAASFRVR